MVTDRRVNGSREVKKQQMCTPRGNCVRLAASGPVAGRGRGDWARVAVAEPGNGVFRGRPLPSAAIYVSSCVSGALVASLDPGTEWREQHQPYEAAVTHSAGEQTGFEIQSKLRRWKMGRSSWEDSGRCHGKFELGLEAGSGVNSREEMENPGL